MGELLARLPEDDAATLRAWCEPREWDTASIVKALKAENHKVTHPAIAHHKARVAILRRVRTKTAPCSCESA